MDNPKDYRWNSYIQIMQNNNNIINSDYILGFFESLAQFRKFVNEKNSDKCMEYENKVFLSDLRCVRMIKAIFGLESLEAFIRMDPTIQKKNLSYLKQSGMTISQLTRLTGLPRKIVQIA